MTTAARIAARTIHPLQSNVPAERAAQAAQDHILSVPALREITPAAILDAHRAAARAVVTDCPIPSPAECDAQTAALIAEDEHTPAYAHVRTCRYFEPVTITPAQDHTRPAILDGRRAIVAAHANAADNSTSVFFDTRTGRTEVYFLAGGTIEHRAAFVDGRELDSMLYAILDWTRDNRPPAAEYTARMIAR